MKELVQIWNRVTSRRYSAVNTNDRELRDFSNNRLQHGDINDLHGNLAECEGLNKFAHGNEFNESKNAIINRLFERRKKGQVTRQPKNSFVVLLFGFISVGAGLFILIFHPYDFLFKMKTKMADGGEIYEMWRKPQIDLYCKIYLFNITNSEEFLSGKDKNMSFQEIGPYVYKENLEHTHVKFNDNGTMSTIPIHPLVWQEELSEGNKEDDVFILPNIALLSIANVVAEKDLVTQFSLNMLIRYTDSQPLVKMTAKEFMMGYKSPLLSLGNKFMPGWITFEKLGLIDRMYDFTGDFETIFTGDTDVTLSGLIDTYKGVTDLPQWNGHHCSNIQNASDGTKFKSGLASNESLLFYRKSLCRAATMVPVKSGDKHGFRANMYTFEDNLLDNGQFNEKNKCFCRNGVCLPAGLIDVTDCYYGFPIALSYPHFYQGDQKLFNKVEGLSPDQNKHETRFWIQPESGLPLQVSSKFQINMALKDLKAISNVEKFSDMVLPMLWFDITMSELPKSMANRFNLYLNVLPVVESCAIYIFVIFGVISIVVVVTGLTGELICGDDTDGEEARNCIINADGSDFESISPQNQGYDTTSDSDGAFNSTGNTEVSSIGECLTPCPYSPCSLEDLNTSMWVIDENFTPKTSSTPEKNVDKTTTPTPSRHLIINMNANMWTISENITPRVNTTSSPQADMNTDTKIDIENFCPSGQRTPQPQVDSATTSGCDSISHTQSDNVVISGSGESIDSNMNTDKRTDSERISQRPNSAPHTHSDNVVISGSGEIINSKMNADTTTDSENLCPSGQRTPQPQVSTSDSATTSGCDRISHTQSDNVVISGSGEKINSNMNTDTRTDSESITQYPNSTPYTDSDMIISASLVTINSNENTNTRTDSELISQRPNSAPHTQSDNVVISGSGGRINSNMNADTISDIENFRPCLQSTPLPQSDSVITSSISRINSNVSIITIADAESICPEADSAMISCSGPRYNTLASTISTTDNENTSQYPNSTPHTQSVNVVISGSGESIYSNMNTDKRTDSERICQRPNSAPHTQSDNVVISDSGESIDSNMNTDKRTDSERISQRPNSAPHTQSDNVVISGSGEIINSKMNADTTTDSENLCPSGQRTPQPQVSTSSTSDSATTSGCDSISHTQSDNVVISGSGGSINSNMNADKRTDNERISQRPNSAPHTQSDNVVISGSGEIINSKMNADTTTDSENLCPSGQRTPQPQVSTSSTSSTSDSATTSGCDSISHTQSDNVVISGSGGRINSNMNADKRTDSERISQRPNSAPHTQSDNVVISGSGEIINSKLNADTTTDSENLCPSGQRTPQPQVSTSSTSSTSDSATTSGCDSISHTQSDNVVISGSGGRINSNMNADKRTDSERISQRPNSAPHTHSDNVVISGSGEIINSKMNADTTTDSENLCPSGQRTPQPQVSTSSTSDSATTSGCDSISHTQSNVVISGSGESIDTDTKTDSVSTQYPNSTPYTDSDNIISASLVTINSIETTSGSGVRINSNMNADTTIDIERFCPFGHSTPQPQADSPKTPDSWTTFNFTMNPDNDAVGDNYFPRYEPGDDF